MSGQAQTATQSPRRFPVERVRDLLASLFAAAGLSPAAARTMGEALVEADIEGLPSHGVMQAEVYLARLRAETLVDTRREGRSIHYRIADERLLQLMVGLAHLYLATKALHFQPFQRRRHLDRIGALGLGHG